MNVLGASNSAVENSIPFIKFIACHSVFNVIFTITKNGAAKSNMEKETTQMIVIAKRAKRIRTNSVNVLITDLYTGCMGRLGLNCFCWKTRS